MVFNEKEVKEIAQKYQLKLLVLFGSQVKGKRFRTSNSDFDFAYQAKKNLASQELIGLNNDLINLSGNNRVDIVNLQGTDPLLKFEISKNCQLIYGDQRDFLEFKAQAFKAYIDAQPLFDLENKLIKRKQAKLGRFLHG